MPTISQLPTANNVADSDELPISQSGTVRSIAYSVDPDQPFRPIVITDSGDRDHVVHYA
jgi:hypothetical protein